MLFKERSAAVVVGLSVTGLGTVRSLARAGIRVIGVDSNFDQPSAHTRYCQKVYCKDINDEDELLKTLTLISKKNKTKPVLFLSTDMSVLIASEHRDLLEDYYHFSLPSKSVVQTFMDKALFSDFAKKNGFQIPETFIVESLEDIKSIASCIRYPCVFKPSFRTPAWDKATSIKVFKAFSRNELVNIYQENSCLATKFIIQELILGADREVYFCLLWYNSFSQPIASFVGRKPMQWIPEMGSTCIAENYSNDIVLNESIKLFNAANYRGIGSVEFKRDSRDSVFRIVEPTVGRVDLQSAIAYHGGVNIPLLEYCECLALKQPEFLKQKVKRYWVNEENLFWLLGNQPDRYPLKEWGQVITSRKCFALFDLRDIGPFLHLFGHVFRIVLGK